MTIQQERHNSLWGSWTEVRNDRCNADLNFGQEALYISFWMRQKEKA